MSTTKSPRKPAAPKWATRQFEWMLDQLDRLNDVLHLTMQGISGIRGMPRLVEVLAQVDDSKGNAKERIESARRAAKLADSEVSAGYPLIHAQAVVTLWSYLEAAVRAFIADWIRNAPGAVTVPAIGRIKVELGEYESLSEDERHLYIFDRFEQGVAAGLRKGVTRFEALLEPFELSGPIPDVVRRDIFELSQVRNALLHRGGLADRTLVAECPWLGLSVGDAITVTHKQFHRYLLAVHQYAVILVVRVGEYYGVDMSQFKEEGWESADVGGRA